MLEYLKAQRVLGGKMQKTVKSFSKNKLQEIRVGISEFQGNDLVDIRVWTQNRDTGEMVPTPKGVNINVSLFPDLKDAILALEKELKDNNLI